MQLIFNIYAMKYIKVYESFEIEDIKSCFTDLTDFDFGVDVETLRGGSMIRIEIYKNSAIGLYYSDDIEEELKFAYSYITNETDYKYIYEIKYSLINSYGDLTNYYTDDINKFLKVSQKNGDFIESLTMHFSKSKRPHFQKKYIKGINQ